MWRPTAVAMVKCGDRLRDWARELVGPHVEDRDLRDASIVSDLVGDQVERGLASADLVHLRAFTCVGTGNRGEPDGLVPAGGEARSGRAQACPPMDLA
jgi:hypothetical protein